MGQFKELVESAERDQPLQQALIKALNLTGKVRARSAKSGSAAAQRGCSAPANGCMCQGVMPRRISRCACEGCVHPKATVMYYMTGVDVMTGTSQRLQAARASVL